MQALHANVHLHVGSVLEEVTAAGDAKNVDPEQNELPAKNCKTREGRRGEAVGPSMCSCMHACMFDSGIDHFTRVSDMLNAVEASPVPVKVEACRLGKLKLQKLRVDACRTCC